MVFPIIFNDNVPVMKSTRLDFCSCEYTDDDDVDRERKKKFTICQFNDIVGWHKYDFMKMGKTSFILKFSTGKSFSTKKKWTFSIQNHRRIHSQVSFWNLISIQKLRAWFEAYPIRWYKVVRCSKELNMWGGRNYAELKHSRSFNSSCFVCRLFFRSFHSMFELDHMLKRRTK